MIRSRSSFSSPLRFLRFASQALDHRRLVVRSTESPKPKQPIETLVFGRTFTDHMLQIEFTSEKGWDAPQIVPYGPLSISPASSCLHYGIECFEGMKAYLDADQRVRLFRPDMNMNRLNSSAKRLQLPQFDSQEFLECIKSLLRVEKSWIPHKHGYSLYIRPTLIGTQGSLGVGPSHSALLYVILSPVGPYYSTGFKAVNLLATDKFVRAWPGGTGAFKVGGNYATGIYPQVEANKQGFAQILWLFENHLTEVGTMNAFVFWRNKNGERELVTPPLDGTILPGVTRASILELARKWGEFSVSERPVTITDLIDALKDNRLLEVFGAGTAAIVAPVKGIEFQGTLHKIPLDPNDATSEAGPLARRLTDEILSIQYGETPSDWSVLVD